MFKWWCVLSATQKMHTLPNQFRSACGSAHKKGPFLLIVTAFWSPFIYYMLEHKKVVILKIFANSITSIFNRHAHTDWYMKCSYAYLTYYEPAHLWPYTALYSWWWVRLSPEIYRVKQLRIKNAIVESCWTYFTTITSTLLFP